MEDESLELAFGSELLYDSGLDGEEIDLTFCFERLRTGYKISLGWHAVLASDFVKKIDGAG